MRAIRIHQFGPPDVLRLEELAIPAPGEGEVLVRIQATGVGPWDGWIRSGHSALPQPLPLTPGSDLSGVVEAIGPGVASIAVGSEVFGVTNPNFTGAHAEFALARAVMIARKPRRLTHVQAASIPVVATTAYQALFEEAALTKGQSVLILGGAGNVGAYAVQLARQAELHVIATASARDLETVRRLGADEVVDHRAVGAQAFERLVRDVDGVIDLVGGEAQTRAFGVLKQGGRLVSAVSQPDQTRATQHGITAYFFLVNVTTERLVHLGSLLEGGRLETHVGTILPLAEARRAHEMLEGIVARPPGKIVLEVAG